MAYKFQGHPLILTNLCTLIFLLLYVDFSTFPRKCPIETKTLDFITRFPDSCTHHAHITLWLQAGHHLSLATSLSQRLSFLLKQGTCHGSFHHKGPRIESTCNVAKPFLYSRRCHLEKTRTFLLSKSNYKSSFTPVVSRKFGGHKIFLNS